MSSDQGTITQPRWEFFGNIPDGDTFDHEGVRLKKCAPINAELCGVPYTYNSVLADGGRYVNRMIAGGTAVLWHKTVTP